MRALVSNLVKTVTNVPWSGKSVATTMLPWWYRYLAATAAVGLSNALIGLAMGYLSLVTNLSMLNLISVLVVAIAFGRGPAIWASLCSFFVFNWFFIQPLHTLTIADANEWVVLLVFLLTAITTSQLAAGQRQRAQEFEQRERETAVLYDTAQLLGEPGLENAIRAVAERLRQELRLSAVSVEWPGEAGRTERAVAGAADSFANIVRHGQTPVEVLTSGSAPSDTQRGSPGRWVSVVAPVRAGRAPRIETAHVKVVPVEVAHEPAGQIVLVQEQDDPRHGPSTDRLVSAVASQIGLAVERARLRREATETEILRRAEGLRTALLNAVSHDLRTPLASIIASAGSLRRKDLHWTNTDLEEFATVIEDEASRLNRIVGNLLDLSRLEAGALQPERDWYDLGALVDDVLGRLKPLTAGHLVRVDVSDDLPPVHIDYVEIDQVLSNLLENAAKYSPPGGEIAIRVHQVDDQVRVEVRDTGPGIPAGDLTRIFDPFYRGSGLAPQLKGTGLGLAVARGLVQAHGGTIWAENAKTIGSRFTFTLPLPAVAAVASDTQARGVGPE